jgi:hypothetical protein
MSATHINPNNRASLLSGLRTGGVRSASAPHTASPNGSFNIVPFPQALPAYTFTEEDEGDQIYEMPQRHVYNNRNIPTTAAVDGPNNRFASQQRGMNPHTMPFNLSTPQVQLQMMQLEMMRLQALQAQQLQTEMLAQQFQQQQQQQAAAQARERRTSLGFNPPATAGPMTNSFNIGTNGPMRRPSQADFLRAQLGVGTPSVDHVPMTAAMGGRFGARSTSLNTHPSSQIDQPGTPNPATTIISGGTSLGNTSPNNIPHAAVVTPSKSDAASSWRRGGNNNSVLTPNRVVSSASRVGQRSSPPPALETSASSNTHLGVKFRPQPLRFNAAVSQPLPTVTIDNDDTDDAYSCGSSVQSIKSSPTTSTSSHEMPLSPREEASKKLFQGLGISRPVSATPPDQGIQQAIPIICTTPPAPGHRLVSQPKRQPRGPPSGADELGPKNFATRIRRRAIGGLGLLIGARDRREAVEAF